MLKRDFSKSNKEYFKKNKYVLCATAVFLVIGIIIACIFGFNGNFEVNGYNQFSVNIGSVSGKDANKSIEEIKSIVNYYGGDYDAILVQNEGDLTEYIVRYSNEVNEDKQNQINSEISNKLNIEITKISEHIFVEPVVDASDIIYTSAAILLILVIATLFTYFRYNGASAIAVLTANIIGTLGFISFASILRLSIGLSYFAMLVILNMLIFYCSFNIFETIKESNLLENNDYENAIGQTMKKSRFKLCLISVAVMIIGLLFVLIAPDAARYISLNIMFMAVVLLAVSCYVVPFMWSVFITHCNKRKVVKEKNKN